jgi:uncharacterized membrane protein
MNFLDILRLAIRNLREARLRVALTTVGVVVGVAVIVSMVSFGLGLQRNTLARFRELDLFNEIEVFGRSLSNMIEMQEKMRRLVVATMKRKRAKDWRKRDGGVSVNHAARSTIRRLKKSRCCRMSSMSNRI